MNASYSFIENVNDFFSTGYFTEDFQKKVFDKSGYSADGIRELCSRFGALRQQYNRHKADITSRYAREKDKIPFTHEFNSKILECLGYYGTTAENPATVLSLPLGENGAAKEFPVRIVRSKTDGSPQLYVMDIPTLITADNEAEIGFADLDLDRMVTHIFSLPEHEHPQYILLLSGNKVFFMDAGKWERGAYLQFDVERLLVETTQSSMRNYFALFYLLVSQDALSCTGDTPLMQQLEEESYKNAYAVTQDLKKGVVSAVEDLANEAIWYIKQHPEHKYYEQDETDDNFEAMMRDDCLVYIYRLLFIFYAESRPELDILPINDKTYQRGYSLEMLRDLEQVNLITEESRSGYFFDSSIKQLFSLILGGYNEDKRDETSLSASFRVRHIDSPLFSDNKLKVLKGVQFRNEVWQRIICQLSLSQQQKGKARGRISYANLGINQLGSVYENLLAYRGFYAEEDYIEVHPVGDEIETYLVPRSRRDDFKEEEILKRLDNPLEDVIHKKGQFIYRLNGRDRKKSASFYTPEVLTKSTVKYTLKPIVERLERKEITASDLLQMKILEPAMGAAAFQNEVINQLALLYLNFRKNEVNEAIDPLEFPNELQKVKAYIATNNVYGVDLNATALELGKLSLWLNVIHKDMETPFFSNRIAQGNAVIGAWLKVYSQRDVVRDVVVGRPVDKQWWEAPTKRISFSLTAPKRHYTEVYHFLLPVKDMLGLLSTKQCERTDSAYKRFVEIRKGWTKGITSEEYEQLKRISSKIDVLLKEYVQFQMSIEKFANNGYHVWKYDGNRTIPFNTNEERQALDDRRYRKNSPYMKVKKVMDYWCSLFFWEFEDAAALPTRQQYWDDIERMLDVDTEKGVKVLFSNAGKDGQEDLFTPKQGRFVFDNAEEESEIKAKTLNELLNDDAKHQEGVLNLGEGISEVDRFSIVERLADRYHFFHPMLEFLEVFWLRDGFDIICGNPPWLKLEFNDADIVAEKFPEVAVRRMAAPDVRKKLTEYFKKDADRHIKGSVLLEEIYRDEENENVGSAAFMNAHCNYPLLEGQQTNLYKCVLENGFSLLSDKGFMGLLHPETVFDDPKGLTLRKEIYKRLRYHFQYANEFSLFSEVDHHTKFGEQIYGSRQEKVNFLSIHDLYHPSTIDNSLTHTGTGICGGLKDANGRWNIEGHRDRVIRFTENELQILADAFENGGDWQSVKLTSIHAKVIVDILEKISKFSTHVSDYNSIITVDLDETGAVNSGIISRETFVPNVNNYEMVYNGPQFFVGNPCYKTPRENCRLNSDYDTVDLLLIEEDYIARSNYRPRLDLDEYKKLIPGFVIGKDESGQPKQDCWIDYYKVGFRKMLAISGERSLICAVLPRRTAHIHGVISSSFRRGYDSVDMAALCAALPMDAYIKIMASQNLTSVRIQGFPLGIDPKYNYAMRSRCLLLNCLTTAYADLWQEMWNEDYKSEKWSITDGRLKPFNTLTEEWKWETPLRNYFERRQALVEIDVISAMALGLTLEDLEMIYTIQFPVLQQYENDTWYDAEGKIVFTCSKGLTGVGLDRPKWNEIRGEQKDENTFIGTSDTYIHTIDPSKSELYGGQQQVFKAPYTRCDRIADYRRAWAHFEKVFSYDQCQS